MYPVCIPFFINQDLILDLRNKVNYNFLDLKYGLSFSLWLYHYVIFRELG